MSLSERRVDWEGVKQCVGTLAQVCPEFLTRSVLIGGGACWFYRVQLAQSSDTEFQEAKNEASEDVWLSKDIDFTGIFRADAYDMLPQFVVMDQKGNAHLEVAGVRIGFAQVGVTFDPEEVLSRARIAEFNFDGRPVQFLVIDPISLYREKQALALKRNAPNDHAHSVLLTAFLSLEFVRAALAYVRNSRSPEQQQQLLSLLLDFKHRAIEIAQDPHVQRRIKPVADTDNLEAKWLRNTFQL